MFDILIRNGLIFDGSGGAPFCGDIGITGKRIGAIGKLDVTRSQHIIDADGLAIAPGFINMLSWACESLLEDGRSQSDIRQGVTLEVMGEGFSYGPLNNALKQELIQRQGDIHFDVSWNTLDEYLAHLVERGVSTNVGSFVGTATLRAYVMGYDDRPATQNELDQICELARRALKSGAFGVSSALAYVPDIFYRTEELVSLARVAAEQDRLYIAHMRGEGDHLLEGIHELIYIAEQSGARVEIYHFKVAGWRNWHKLDQAMEKIESAQARGIKITANLYPYCAAASGLDLVMPPWVQEGGHQAWVARLKDTAIRERLKKEICSPGDSWENAFVEVENLDGILLVDFKNPALKHLTGKTLAEVAALRGQSPEETVMDLIIEDDSRVGVVYFTMSEDNLRRQIQLPWVSLCSDAASLAPEGVFLRSSTHPRAYGSFARFLGKYVRDEGLISLPEAIRRLTSLPAENLRLTDRGLIKPGYYADLVVFDAEKIQDEATYLEPHQYASGVQHVIVNGEWVIQNGEHTGALPGMKVEIW